MDVIYVYKHIFLALIFSNFLHFQLYFKPRSNERVHLLVTYKPQKYHFPKKFISSKGKKNLHFGIDHDIKLVSLVHLHHSLKFYQDGVIQLKKKKK